MQYKNYTGVKVAYMDLTKPLQHKAWRSFYDINFQWLFRRQGNIHTRINERFIRQRWSSFALLKNMERNEDFRCRIFTSNLVEFTTKAEYLNWYLEA